MNSLKSTLILVAVLCAATSAAIAQNKSANSVTVVFKDHHEKTFTSAEVSSIDLRNGKLVILRAGKPEEVPLSDVARIEFNDATGEAAPGRGHFIGRWEVGMGGSVPGSFITTLDRDGSAHKTVGGHSGTWTYIDGHALVTWDDGWRDIIIEVGKGYEKRAYEPGRKLTETPTNVTWAKRANQTSI